MSSLAALPKSGEMEHVNDANLLKSIPFDEKRDVEEASQPSLLAVANAAHGNYHPANDHEKALDNKINRKLDFFVVALLGINFMLTGIDKSKCAACTSYESPCTFTDVYAPSFFSL